MAKVQDIARGPARFRENRADPKEGEGWGANLVSAVNAELVTPNGLVWNNEHMGRVYSEPSTNPYPQVDQRKQGDRADITALGGYTFVNYPAPSGTRHGGNDSGE